MTAPTPAAVSRRGLLVGVSIVVLVLVADTAVLALRHARVSLPMSVEHAALMAVAPPAQSLAAQVVPAAIPNPPAEARPTTASPHPRPSLDLSPGWEQRRGAEALGLITYPWQRLGYSIVFEGPRAGLLGGTIPERRLIILFIRSDEDVNRLASIIAHEIGHAIDKAYNDDGRRERWLKARRLPSTMSWFTCNKCPDFATGSGDFAESFVAWQTGGAYFRGQLAPPPSEAQLATLQGFFQP